jgi:hypothetical protein
MHFPGTRFRLWHCFGAAGTYWSDMDWLAFFDERASIAEFDGGLPRSSAEARAFECCVVEWLNRNPARSLPGQCAACGGPNHEHDVLLPYGVEPAGLTWLHSRCWSAWYRDQGSGQGAISNDTNTHRTRAVHLSIEDAHATVAGDTGQGPRISDAQSCDGVSSRAPAQRDGDRLQPKQVSPKFSGGAWMR